MSQTEDPLDAYDAAFTSGDATTIDDDAPPERFDVAAWQRAPDLADLALFVAPCTGPTLDVGCGPGRLVAELSGRGLPTLGIDVSREAVRQTRVRGADALRLDVFDTIPGEGQWQWALLADGNVGIGGDPVRLLSRIREVLDPCGALIAEVEPAGTPFRTVRRRLVVDGVESGAFDWAVVGLDDIEPVAVAAGLRVSDRRAAGGRHAVTLVRP